MSDPQGRRALFETPARPGAGDGQAGRDALFSGAARQAGNAAITCSRCGLRTRTTLGDAAARVLRVSMWFPWRHYNRWIRCPACRHRAWCRVHWLG
jgi:hypothetical protein